MSGKTRHLSKTDLRRGLFTKTEKPPPVASAPAPAAFPAATSAAEQALLFDLVPPEAAPKTHTGKSANVVK